MVVQEAKIFQVRLQANSVVVEEVAPGVKDNNRNLIKAREDEWIHINGLVLLADQYIRLIAGKKPGIDQIHLDIVVTPEYAVIENTWPNGSATTETIPGDRQGCWMGIDWQTTKALLELN